MQTEITYIAIKNLVKSPRNVRKVKPSAAADKELLAGIRARGLLQNLTVTPSKKKDQYEVTAGGRRLNALKKLVKEKHLKDTDKVPCLVRDPEEALEELAIMENTQRHAMHPADEFEAFQKMLDAGLTVEQIAAELGQTQKYVKQRLKLAGVAPKIIKAYRNDKIPLECVMAFTITDDQSEQIAVFDELTEGPGNRLHSSRQVRQLLQKESVSSKHKTARFVGKAAYSKAGGRISADLFRDEELYLDGEILNTLAFEKLSAAAAEIKDDWNWTEVAIDNHHLSLHTIEGKETEKSREISQQHQKVQELIDTLEEKSEEDWTDADDKHYQRLEEQLDELEGKILAAQAYDPAEMKLSGCLVTISYSGELMIDKGLVRKSDMKALQAMQSGKSLPPKTTSDSQEGSGEEIEEEVDLDHYSQALTDSLTSERTAIAKLYLARRYADAYNLLVFTMCMEQLTNTWHDSALRLQSEQTCGGDGRDSEIKQRAYQEMFELRSKLPLDWMKVDDDVQRFENFCEIPTEDKHRLMAFCTAIQLEGSLNIETGAGSPLMERILHKLNITWSDYWRPTAENFLGRIKKGQLIAFGAAFLGDLWKREASKKKVKELAAELENTFAGNDGRLNAETGDQVNDTTAANWMPPGFEATDPETHQVRTAA